MPKPVQFYISEGELARPSVIFVMSMMMLGVFKTFSDKHWSHLT